MEVFWNNVLEMNHFAMSKNVKDLRTTFALEDNSSALHFIVTVKNSL